MKRLPINDAQREVLDWLAAGGSQDPPRPEMKLSAAALKTRGLVRVHRSKGLWTAELTDAGRYFFQHGDYPPQPETPRTTRPRPRNAPAKAVAAKAPETPHATASALADTPDDTSDEVPLRQLLRRPHAAVKELRDRPGRLPTFASRRCVLIAHSLVTDAVARGWTVTPVVGTTKRDWWDGQRSTHYDQRSLLLIDAGRAKIGLHFTEVTRRVPHQRSEEEAATRANGGWVPAYDYVGTGKLRLQLTENDRKLTDFSDGARGLVEDQLPAVLAAIEEATARVLRREEEERRRREEEAARQREAERIRPLREAYEGWEAQLVDRSATWARHLQMRVFLDAVEAECDKAAVPFIEWARGFLDSTDPRRGLPAGSPPRWSHAERVTAGRLPPKPVYRW